MGLPISSKFCCTPPLEAHQRLALACPSIRSIMTNARICLDLGAYGPFHLASIPTLRAMLHESAEAKGIWLNSTGSSIRSPCSLVLGMPSAVHATRITSAMRAHQAGAPGSAYIPEEPNATRG